REARAGASVAPTSTDGPDSHTRRGGRVRTGAHGGREAAASPGSAAQGPTASAGKAAARRSNRPSAATAPSATMKAATRAPITAATTGETRANTTAAMSGGTGTATPARTTGVTTGAIGALRAWLPDGLQAELRSRVWRRLRRRLPELPGFRRQWAPDPRRG